MADRSEQIVPAVSEPDRPVTLRASPLAWALDSRLTLPIVAASGLALVLGLIRLGGPSLWLDETFSARAVRELRISPLDQYHWLYYWIETPWASLAGTSEWALRFPSVVGAMLACGLLVVLADQLFDRGVALASGLFLAANPFVVMWSQQARGYTLLLAVVLAATLLLLRALDRGSRVAWVAYGLAYTAIVAWHPVSGVLLAPAHAVLVVQRRERALPHGFLAALVVVGIALPWAAQVAIRSTGEGVAMNWLKAPSATEAAQALLDVSGVAGFGLFFALLGLGVLRRTGRSEVGLWLATWAFSPFVVALVVSVVRPIYLDRYLIVAAPAYALLAGVAVIGVDRRWRAVPVGVAVIATSIGLVRWYGTADSGNWRGEDWRSAVRTVLARRGESEAVVVAPWSAAPAARYYGARVSDTSTADSIWVLTWSETDDDLTEADRQTLGFGEHRLVERLEFGRRVNAELWKRAP